MKSIEYSQNLNCRYYHEMIFSQKQGSFVEPIWKIWTAFIMTGFNFLKYKGVFMISSDNLKCSYYYELKFLQKYPIFDEAIWTFELPYYHEV